MKTDNREHCQMSSFSGISLILIGCCQLVYSSVAVLTAVGVGAIEFVLWMLIFLAPTMKPPDFSAFIDSALLIGTLGLGLAVCAIAGGILVLRNKGLAIYAVAVFVILSLALAYRHFVLAWHTVSAIYAILGVLFTAWLVIKRGKRPDESGHYEPPTAICR